jgi:hypothetical protein
MASSDFTVNGSSLPAAISTTWGATVTCSLVSTQRVNSVAWSVLGKSRSTLTTPTLVSSGSPSGAIMTFTFPSAGAYGAYGGSLLIQCVVTYSVAGKARTHTTRAMIGVPIPGTALVPGAIGETTERGTYGWLDLLNNQLAALSGLVVAGTSSDVAITGGGGATTLYDYPLAPVAAEDQTIEVDLRIEVWQASNNDATATIHTTAYVLVKTAGSTILNAPDTEQTVLGTLTAGVSVAFSITANTTLRTSCTSTVTNMKASVSVAHLAARTRS